MERDFLGLSSKDPLATVKQEIAEEETQWPFMKKASSFPHFMSFRAGASDDEMNKMIPDAFDSGKRSSMGEIQNFSLPVSNPLVKPSYASSGHSVADAITRQQFRGVPTTVTSPVGPVVGFTEPRNNLKSFATPAQMTIFYAGTVNVYDGISPEKAQAIMLLAGNGSFLGSSTSPQTPQVQSPFIKFPSNVADGALSNQPLSSQPGTGVSNPLSVPSQATLHSGSVSANKDECVVTNAAGITSASVSKPEHQRVVASRAPISVPAMVPSAVPQFRKASLARFLEKRKERVMSTGPYSCEKKQQDGVVPANKDAGSAIPSAVNSGTSPAAAVRGS